MQNSRQHRSGSALPTTFVVMLVASLLTAQSMQGMIHQKRNLLMRYQTRQSLEWIEVGKLRIQAKIALDKDYVGEDMSLHNLPACVDSESLESHPKRMTIRRLEATEPTGPRIDFWEVNVFRSDDFDLNTQASWQGEL
ncbi:MAG: hypothetical protein SGI77_19845 [Pirellulaceae bacterium]|nr:hypothetical protein [Pirellulaceae bacterium]